MDDCGDVVEWGSGKGKRGEIGVVELEREDGGIASIRCDLIERGIDSGGAIGIGINTDCLDKREEGMEMEVEMELGAAMGIGWKEKWEEQESDDGDLYEESE